MDMICDIDFDGVPAVITAMIAPDSPLTDAEEKVRAARDIRSDRRQYGEVLSVRVNDGEVAVVPANCTRDCSWRAEIYGSSAHLRFGPHH